jgi:putative peptide zinc metalloprotease protein
MQLQLQELRTEGPRARRASRAASPPPLMNDTITPRLRADVELKPFDEYEGDDRFVVAVDDRHLVVSAGVAIVLDECRAHTTLDAVARSVSTRLGFPVSTEMVGDVLSAPVLSDCFHVPEQRAQAECPIRFRQRIVPTHALKALLLPLRWLFTRPVAAAVITTLVLIELLVFQREHEATPSLSGTQIVCSVALTMLGVVVHELGHLTACSRFGARHGGIGLGLYWCMPVLYAEVSGAWMLPRLQRAIVDAGGVYFQCVYLIGLGAAYLASGATPFLEAMTWTHFLMLHTLNPVLKYDGYWLLTDLAGMPNLHEQIRMSARQAWLAVRHAARAPSLRQLVLLGAFGAMAAAYFVYTLSLLGKDIGHGASEIAHRWALRDTAPFGNWHVVGESALLGLLVVMALSIACLLARSIQRIGKDPQA